MDFLSNITFRKKTRRSQSPSITNKSKFEDSNISSDNSILDGTTSSLPCMSEEECNLQLQLRELRNEILILKNELSEAQGAIKHLALENSELKSTISDMGQKCGNNSHKPISTEKITQTIPTEVNLMDEKTSTPSPPEEKQSKSPYISPSSQQFKEQHNHINRMCIVSSNKKNKILQIAENTIENFEFCHYIYPDCNVIKLIDNLSRKIIDFTEKDYCVIMIGEEDFVRTINYHNLIAHIRSTLQTFKHTNIIICTPTYRYHGYSVLFNSRVEAFNNMLFEDNETFKYAIIMDSNLKLLCSHSMFSVKRGTLNNNGILNKKDVFELTIQDLENKYGQIDIICLTETFMKKGTESNLNICNYRLAASFSRTDLRRGGSCILVRKHLDFKQILFNLIDPIPFHFEFCCTEVVQLKLYIVCIYRIPNPNATVFLQSLNALLKKLTKKSRHIILCGDWNIDLLKPNNYFTKELHSTLKNYNIANHITTPTRKGACLDLISSNISNVTPDTHFLALSDHETGQTISFQITNRSNEGNAVKRFWFEKRRDFSKDNTKKFISCMEALSFNDVHECMDVDEAFNLLHDNITLFYNLCFPIVNVKIVNKPIKING
ncbi:hypothetical protein HF086_003378 [Spodoptera exigua]|uniref:Endonuclease/exonuclease/phosphatase domain-containing protein n=1 Tax=Spodoptera exigua TaxID=7107 RepID=A0A922N1Q4_SPOEX|nr:hypothetical protein HF086_003378 [Spodoptera exigua]